MAINRLEQQAFMASIDFIQQVESVWLQEIMAALAALETKDSLSDIEELKETTLKQQIGGTRDVLGMIQLIVADAGWVTTYSTWAADTDAQDGAIRAGVQKVMKLI